MAFLCAAGEHDSGPVHSGSLVVDENALAHGATLHAAIRQRLLHDFDLQESHG